MDEIYILEKETIPLPLRHIPQPPSKLYVRGKMPAEDIVLLCVVGAREHSSYGEEVCKKLIVGLKGYNICIVSGLAIGIDGIAHRSAIDAGLQTIAFPGSGLNPDVLYPTSHARLAEEIVYAGGALISEFKMDQIGAPWTFPQRNRLMAGISKATLVIEAELQSGTLITSRLATDYNRDVGAVPGNIFSPLSAGPHMLIRGGAIPITCSDDILEMLGFERRDGMGPEQRAVQANLFSGLNEKEKRIVELLQIEPRTTEQLVLKTGTSAREINEIVSSLEVQGLIEERGGVFIIK
jgi:DNA processing protein